MLTLAGCEKIQQALHSSKSEDVAAADGSPVTLGEGHELSPEDFENFKATAGKVVVVDFYADWCGPCRNLGPKLEKVTAEFGDKVVMGKVNVDNARSLASRLGVSGIPDVRIFVGGAQTDQIIGDQAETAVRQKVQLAVAALDAAASAAGEGGDKSAEPIIQPMKKDWMPEGMERR
ncbi:hypothetical protein Hsar01_03074 [Haloferula sargassicola]|uniref:Thioredoxin domain-containing protein n=2 Tax=Haloferula sargassicola TaxID=490096 RepID=A0ABP9UQL2_9BACT